MGTIRHHWTPILATWNPVASNMNLQRRLWITAIVAGFPNPSIFINQDNFARIFTPFATNTLEVEMFPI